MSLRALLLLALVPGTGMAELRYTVRTDVAAGHFEVQVCTEEARERLEMRARRGAVRFVQLQGNGAFALEQGRLVARALAAGACRSYRVDAAAAMRASVRRERWLPADTWLIEPKWWLWRPRGEDVVLRFAPAVGSAVSVPWPQAADGTVRVAAGSGLAPALAAFGAVDLRRLRLGGGVLQVAVVGSGSAQRRTLLHAWIAGVARSLLSVHGQLPLPHAQVLVVEVPGRGGDAVPWGQSARGGSMALHLYVRRSANAQALREDWVATHEFAHLLHPYLGDRGRWLSEGLASYYQNVLRARSGALDEQEAWRRLHAGFGRGQRDHHDLPLEDVSRRMGRLGATMRTYWSGAAFWLQADVALRRRGSSLDAVLGGFAECCLPARGRWTPERFVAELDRLAGGAPVFAPRHAELSRSHAFPSLQRVYALLGLRDGGEGLRFAGSEDAAALRRAIMQGP